MGPPGYSITHDAQGGNPVNDLQDKPEDQKIHGGDIPDGYKEKDKNKGSDAGAGKGYQISPQDAGNCSAGAHQRNEREGRCQIMGQIANDSRSQIEK